MTAWQIEPLGPWTRPVTDPRASSGRFRATWDQTLKLLVAEVDLLQPTGAIAIRVDADPSDIRRDGMLRARAKVDFPGVIVSFTSAVHGPLSYATDAYEQRWYNDLASWQANVRAIALSLEALRAVDRYGVSRSGEQYVGWRAIEAAPSGTFASADEALRWVRAQAPDGSPEWTPRQAYLAAAKLLHPDVGGDVAQWDRLDEARRLMQSGGMW
jgi:hypothetical protein